MAVFLIAYFPALSSDPSLIATNPNLRPCIVNVPASGVLAFGPEVRFVGLLGLGKLEDEDQFLRSVNGNLAFHFVGSPFLLGSEMAGDGSPLAELKVEEARPSAVGEESVAAGEVARDDGLAGRGAGASLWMGSGLESVKRVAPSSVFKVGPPASLVENRRSPP